MKIFRVKLMATSKKKIEKKKIKRGATNRFLIKIYRVTKTKTT